MRKSFIAFLLVSATTLLVAATTLGAQTPQKVGHLNLGNFLASLPEVHTVDSLLQQYQQSLLDTLQQMDNKLKTDYEAYQKNINNLTPVQAREKEQQLMKADQEIKAYAQRADSLLAAKRQVLLTPILDKLDKAVKAVGKAGHYAVILDASIMNALLYAEDSDDVEALVREEYKKY